MVDIVREEQVLLSQCTVHSAVRGLVTSQLGCSGLWEEGVRASGQMDGGADC